MSGWTWTSVSKDHLCVLEGVAAGVFDVVGGLGVAFGIHVDGALCPRSQELLPDVVDQSGYFSDGTLLQLLHRQPEPEQQASTYYVTNSESNYRICSNRGPVLY